MFFSHEFIEQVKKATDIVNLVQDYTELKKGGSGIWIGKCPHPKHKDDTPSFRVWEKDQSWACMSCHFGKKGIDGNFGSDCFAFLQWIENISWTKAVLKLAKKAGLEPPKEENEALYKNNKILALSLQKGLYGKAKKYFADRGLNDKTMVEWLLGFDGKKLVFPLIDRYGRIIAFNKRWLELPENCHDKYKNSCNSEIFNKSSYFYGLHKLDTSFKEIRITEGPMDVITAIQFGAKNVVATLGTSFTEQHAAIINNLKLKPVLIYDGDEKGQEAIKRAVEILAAYSIQAKVCILNNNKDLADFSLEKGMSIENYIQKNSISYGQYKLSNMINLYESKMLEIKMEIYPELKKLLNEIPNVIERKILKDSINDKLKINL